MPPLDPTSEKTDHEPSGTPVADPTRPMSLSELLQEARLAPPACIAGFVDRVWVICNLAEVLRTAHAEGRTHGDLRPGHIIVSPHGGVSVEGWGGSTTPDSDADPYRAPESAASTASDMYALGAILWELLTLRPALVVEENLTRFHRRKLAGEVDPLPAEVRSAVPADLLDIARRAMAPDPALRWHSMEELLTALHGWLHRLESVAVTLQAESELAASAQGRGDAGRAADSFRSALALWPGNPAAQDGMAAAATAQTLAAINNGDESAAQQHLDQSAGASHAAVTAEFHRLHARNRRRRWGRVMLLGCLILTIVAGIGLWKHQRNQATAWRSDAEWVFVRGASTHGLESTWRFLEEQEPLPPPLEDGLSLPRGRTIWIRDVDGRGDVRLGIEVVWPKAIDGIELLMSAQQLQPPVWYMTPPGYACQFGGFRGTQTFLSSSQEAGMPNRPSPVAYTFVPGRSYRLEMERRDDHLRLRIDGTVVWDQREVVPVGDSSYRWLAIRSWAEAKVSRLYVERPSTLPPISPLSTADALTIAGHHADALAAYTAALHADLPQDLRYQAIAKAHLVASRLPDRESTRRNLLQLAERSIPESSPYLLDVLQAESQCLWRSRDWQSSLRMAERIQKQYPGTRCALTLLEQRFDTIPDNILTSLLGLISAGPPVSHLELSGCNLSDLTPLRGMRLESLNISGNRISDLSPIAGMPLHILSCSNNLIRDISPLKGMRLFRLDANDNQISDLTPLTGAPIEELRIKGNRITELGPLAGMPVVWLELERNPISSLAPLSSCKQLENLYISDAPVNDLSPLPLGSLSTLSVIRCPVADLRPLATCRIVTLDLSGTLVTDLSVLPRASVNSLRLGGTPVASLASLSGLTLSNLDLSNTKITTIEGIADINITKQTGLSLDRTAITSLTPLTVPALGQLSICGTRITDLSPLAGRSIRLLQANNIPAESVWPMTQVLGLQQLSLWNTGTPATAIDAVADYMEKERLLPGIAEALHVQAAAKAKDWRRLRAMARRVGAYDRLPMHIKLSFAEATALAVEAGARLPCPLDRSDLRALGNIPAISGWFWVGLRPRTETNAIPRWENGRLDQHLAQLIKPQPDVFQGVAWTCPTSAVLEPLLEPVSAESLPTACNYVVLEW